MQTAIINWHGWYWLILVAANKYCCKTKTQAINVIFSAFSFEQLFSNPTAFYSAFYSCSPFPYTAKSMGEDVFSPSPFPFPDSNFIGRKSGQRKWGKRSVAIFWPLVFFIGMFFFYLPMAGRNRLLLRKKPWNFFLLFFAGNCRINRAENFPPPSRHIHSRLPLSTPHIKGGERERERERELKEVSDGLSQPATRLKIRTRNRESFKVCERLFQESVASCFAPIVIYSETLSRKYEILGEILLNTLSCDVSSCLFGAKFPLPGRSCHNRIGQSRVRRRGEILSAFPPIPWRWDLKKRFHVGNCLLETFLF